MGSEAGLTVSEMIVPVSADAQQAAKDGKILAGKPSEPVPFNDELGVRYDRVGGVFPTSAESGATLWRMENTHRISNGKIQSTIGTPRAFTKRP
jgi:hypothetical protein